MSQKTECCKEHIICRHPWWATGFLFLCLFIFIGMFCSNTLVSKDDYEIELLHDAALVLLTFGILFVACTQLKKISETSFKSKKIAKNDFLLRIDERYSSKEIVRARIIINEIHCETKRGKDINNTEHMNEIAIRIASMRTPNKNTDSADKLFTSENYITLLNFLDLLETIAYLVKKEGITPEDIEELMGHSIIYNFLIFKDWIYARRKNTEDYTYYYEFEELVYKMSFPCSNSKCEKQSKLQKDAKTFISNPECSKWRWDTGEKEKYSFIDNYNKSIDVRNSKGILCRKCKTYFPQNKGRI